MLIGQLMEELIETDRPPELRLCRCPAGAPDNLLLSPIDMVMDEKLADDDSDPEHQSRVHHQESRHREQRVQTRVEEPAGVEIGALVKQLIGILERVVANEMLSLQYDENYTDRKDRIGHLPLPTVPNKAAVSTQL